MREVNVSRDYNHSPVTYSFPRQNVRVCRVVECLSQSEDIAVRALTSPILQFPHRLGNELAGGSNGRTRVNLILHGSAKVALLM